jgi:hypothetical protein
MAVLLSWPTNLWQKTNLTAKKIWITTYLPLWEAWQLPISTAAIISGQIKSISVVSLPGPSKTQLIRLQPCIYAFMYASTGRREVILLIFYEPLVNKPASPLTHKYR